jgi:hypothetical protein
MKSKEQIIQLAKEEYWMFTEQYERGAFVNGYSKCQEDMVDYIFKVAKEFHRLGKYSGNTSDTHFTDIYKETINSLNKQD